VRTRCHLSIRVFAVQNDRESAEKKGPTAILGISLGIKTSGRKAEIVERIQNHPAYQKNGRARATSASNKRSAGFEVGTRQRNVRSVLVLAVWTHATVYGYVQLGGSPRSAKKAKPLVNQLHVAINQLFDQFQGSCCECEFSGMNPIFIVFLLFSGAADPEEPDSITDDGIEAFCAQLGIDPQDPVILVLSWYMDADAMCIYTRDEFVKGLEKLQCRSIEELQAKLPVLRKQLMTRPNFDAIYSVRKRHTPGNHTKD
jgi:hypothetical protein